MAVMDPLRLELVNWREVFGEAAQIDCSAPMHPQRAELRHRAFGLGPVLWIERDDFAQAPPKGFFRLFPGNKVRLKYGVIVECIGCTTDDASKVSAVQARIVPDTRSGTPGADAVKVKGTITWVGAHDALSAELRLYDRLFTDEQPDAGGKDFKAALNPQSVRVVQGFIEPSLAGATAEARFQFERHGYFVADRIDHRAARPVFNRIAGLKDGWGK
jgi:glutaminyl-tRNA synthetase